MQAARIQNHHHEENLRNREPMILSNMHLRSSIDQQDDNLARTNRPKRLPSMTPASVEQIQRIIAHQRFIMVLDVIAAIVGMFGMLLALIDDNDYLFEYDGKNTMSPSTNGTVARYFVSLSTVVLIITITIRAIQLFRFKYQGRFVKNECFLFCKQKGRFYNLEFLACAIHPLPGFYHNFTVTTDFSGSITYSITTIFALLMLFRVYLLLRVASSISKWTGYKAQMAGKKENSNISPTSHFFSIKCFIEDKPVRFLVMSFCLIVFIVAITIRACELPLYIETLSEDGHQDFINFWNAVWLVVVTMTTVGFGDFYPRTHFGRLVDAIVALAGIFMMSMVIMVISQLFQMNTQEKKVSRLTEHMLSRISYQKECSQVVARLLKLNMEKMKLQALSQKHGVLKSGESRIAMMAIKAMYDAQQSLIGRLRQVQKLDKHRTKFQNEDEVSGKKRSLYSEVTENTMQRFTTVKQLFYAIPLIQTKSLRLAQAIQNLELRMRPGFFHLDRVAQEIEWVYKAFKVIKLMPGQDRSESPRLTTPIHSKPIQGTSPHNSDSSSYFKTPPHKFKADESVKRQLFLKLETEMNGETKQVASARGKGPIKRKGGGTLTARSSHFSEQK